MKDNTVITGPMKFEGSLESYRTVGKAASRKLNMMSLICCFGLVINYL